MYWFPAADKGQPVPRGRGVGGEGGKGGRRGINGVRMGEACREGRGVEGQGCTMYIYCIEGRGVEVEWCVGTGRGV